jgi:hypothetical protein
MAEQLDLTTPITPATRTTYTLSFLGLDWDGQAITIRLKGSDGVTLSLGYAGNEAAALMTTLNQLTTPSLYKRVLQKLVTDGKLPAGTVSGSPQ